MTASEDNPNRWSVFYDKLLSKEMRDAHIRSLTRGSAGWMLHPDLTRNDEDWLVEKTRFSAFIGDSSDLEDRLRRRGIDTLLIAGTATNVCCESTARDAMMLNFATIFVADACVATDPDAQQATLANFQTIFGDVLSVDEILAGTDKTVLVERAKLQLG